MIKKATRSTKTDRFRKHAIKPVSSLLALLWPCEAVNCLHFGAWSKQLFNQHFTNESGCPRHKDNFISIVFRNGCHTCAKKSKYSHQPLNKKNNMHSTVNSYSFPFSALTMLVGRQEGHPACKKLGVALLVVTFWLQLCTSYSSSYYHHFHHP